MIMIPRSITEKLDEWVQSKIRKPLVLRGARQTGKTTAIRMFSRKFEQYIELNLERPDHRQIFELNKSFEEIITAIFFFAGKRKNINNTLIFIDEIQNSPAAVTSLRYFHEDTPQYAVIAAGSLFESLIGSQIIFPVGRVEYMAMRPLSFIEFLKARNDLQSIGIIKSLKIPESVHHQLLKLFNIYALTGGMPEVVATYTDTNDLVSLNPVFESLITGYRDDIEKYARNLTMREHLRHILHTGFRYAGERIKFEGFGQSAYRSREMGEAFRTIEKAMLCELIYPVTQPELPLLPDFKRSPRLQWLDTGLVNYFAGIQSEIVNATDLINTWKGIIAEHIVGQELLAYNYQTSAKRHFWVREKTTSTAEVDFVIQFNNMVIPIEVKSGKTGHLRSLLQFMTRAPHNIAVRICSNPYNTEDVTLSNGKKIRLINIPFYLISEMYNILGKFT